MILFFDVNVFLNLKVEIIILLDIEKVIKMII